MYFNLFTPFIVTDPGGAGQRLVTRTGPGRQPRVPQYWGRGWSCGHYAEWGEDTGHCDANYERDNQLISLLSWSRHHHTITGTLCELWETGLQVWSSIECECVSVLYVLTWPVGISIHRDVESTGRLSGLSSAYLQKISTWKYFQHF